ncbi:MAG: T9SS type A sorting domain-containing protein, partial [Bacteroidales bacterium]|nr:T9SS type A sorting domain-containing protein [Bacteroidales bacterium]
NGHCRIVFRLNNETFVDIALFDLNGKKAGQLLATGLAGGYYETILDTDGFTGGVYVLKLSTGNGSVLTKRIVIY